MDDMVNYADWELLFDPLGSDSDLFVNNDILDEIINYCDTANIDTDVLLNGLDRAEPEPDLFSVKPWTKYESDQLLHDCMWTGHCGNKDHPSEELSKPLVAPLLAPAITRPPPPVQSSRSVLIKSLPKIPPVTGGPSPDSPPISDDEDGKKTATLNILAEAICDAEMEVSEEIVNYFDKEESRTSEKPAAPVFRGESDHSYHKEKWTGNPLGIETPSDSDRTLDEEEYWSEDSEIDVVSVSDKYVLPNNPTSRDRQHLQKTMATAINNKTRGGVRVLLPVRGEQTHRGPGRRPNTQRGTKRRYGGEGSTSKRHHGDGCDSDSSEKRNLHNDMERQRRVGLKEAFETLRRVCPSLERKEKAAKVLILNEAAKMCREVKKVEEKLEEEESALIKKRDHMLQYIRALRTEVYRQRSQLNQTEESEYDESSEDEQN